MGRTALHLAAHKNFCGIISKLIDDGNAQVNARDIFGETPLHIAAQSNQGAAAELLLRKGADVNATSQARELNQQTGLANHAQSRTGL